MTYGTKVLDNGDVRIIIPLNPYTKKNSQRILAKKTKYGKTARFIAPSKNFIDYQGECGIFLRPLEIDVPINIKADFYVKDRRKIDLTNLNESLHDILVHYHVIKDDNATIVVSTDGSRVFWDHDNPRTEIYISPAEQTFLKED